MSTIAAQPWLIEVPEEASSQKELSVWDQVKAMHAISREVGGLVPPALAAAMLDLSRQRISQFMKEGRFTIHEFNGDKYLEVRELTSFYAAERKVGRPKITLREQMKRAYEIGQELGEEEFGKK